MSIRIEYSDYVESRTPVDVNGSEKLAVSKDGEAGQITTSQIAALVVVPPPDPFEDFVEAVVDTTGDIITLDLESTKSGNFSGSTSFSAPRQVVLTNAERASVYDFNFEVTVAVPIDFGSDTRSTSALFLNGVFTPQDVGLHKVHAVRRYGTDIFLLDFNGVYSVGDAPPVIPDPGTWVLGSGIWNDSEFWDDAGIWKDTP